MKLSEEDRQLLDELCRQNEVSLPKALKLLETVYDYEFFGPLSDQANLLILK